MDSINLSPTDESPEVILDATSGEFKFKGKSLPEDVAKFYKPIHEWIDEYAKNPNPDTKIEFEFEYFNSASSKQILDILEKFAVISNTPNNVSVVWKFLEDDEDMEEAGESYSEIVNIPFEMMPY